MTANEYLKNIYDYLKNTEQNIDTMIESMKDVDMDFKAMDMADFDDCISRQAVLALQYRIDDSATLSTRDVVNVEDIEELLPVNPQPKTGHCKDCKWWKDSDGIYRRGSHAESQCPINRREVMEGMGYCFMFEQQESEEV